MTMRWNGTESPNEGQVRNEYDERVGLLGSEEL